VSELKQIDQMPLTIDSALRTYGREVIPLRPRIDTLFSSSAESRRIYRSRALIEELKKEIEQLEKEIEEEMKEEFEERLAQIEKALREQGRSEEEIKEEIEVARRIHEESVPYWRVITELLFYSTVLRKKLAGITLETSGEV